METTTPLLETEDVLTILVDKTVTLEHPQPISFGDLGPIQFGYCKINCNNLNVTYTNISYEGPLGIEGTAVIEGGSLKAIKIE